MSDKRNDKFKLFSFCWMLVLIILELIVFTLPIVFAGLVHNSDNYIEIFFTKFEPHLICFYLFSVVVAFVSNILIIQNFKKIAKSKRIEAELQQKNYENELALEYYNKLIENSTEIRKVRHDFNNSMKIIYSLNSENDENSRQKAKKILDDLKKQVGEVTI